MQPPCTQRIPLHIKFNSSHFLIVTGLLLGRVVKL